MKFKKKLLSLIILTTISIGFVNAQDDNLFNLEDKAISFAQISSAPKVILLAWTTWCPYCRKELIRLDKESIKYKDINFFILNIGESKNKVDNFLAKLKFINIAMSKVLLDKNNYIADKFNISAIPVYLIFKNGKFYKQAQFIDDKLINEVFNEN